MNPIARADRLPAEETRDDAFVVRDDADLPLVSDAFDDVRDEFVRSARGNVRPCDRSDTRAAVRASFERQPERTPVGLAGRVVVDAREADVFEPPRGSRTEVSLVVVAVDDHRSLRIELRRRGSVERLEWKVQRTGQVLVFEVVFREHLDDLRVLVAAEPLNLVVVDPYWHGVSSIASRTVT
jgi:hypothetical protein